MAVSVAEPFLRNTLMCTISTAGYVPFVLNLHASLQRIGLGNNLVVYTPDRSVTRKLSAMGVRSVRFGGQRYPKWGDWGTPAFAKIVAYKFAVACEILNSGCNVLFVDSDIVFLRSPVQHLQETIERSPAPLIMQFEAGKNVYNTGFWFAKPEPLVIELFSDIQRALVVDKIFNCDQECFNDIVHHRDAIQIHSLDVALFACGNQFLPGMINCSSHPFPFDSAYLLHFNYLIGKRDKVAEMNRCDALFYPGLLAVLSEKPPLWSRLRGRIRRAIASQKRAS
jgi:hypothetical protein